MRKLIVRDVRCFRARNAIPLAPLTLLVGENSAGKSTLMALARLAWDATALIGPPDFNEEPFQLGPYDAIAHFHGGQGKRAASFVLGAEFDLRLNGARRTAARRSELEFVQVETTFSASNGQPRIAQWSLVSGDIELALHLGRGSGATRSVSIQVGLEHVTIERPQFLTHRYASPIQIATSTLFQMRQAPASEAKVDGNLSDEAIGRIRRILARLEGFLSRGTRPYAIAPIRTRPERTYDPIRDRPNPEGGHVPVVLSRIHAAEPTRWEPLERALRRFGQASGLFEALEVRHLGRKKESEPFQIELVMAGQQGRRNLLDVGYGVSQILPILVDCLLAKSGTVMLLQQPEVHLHPRAQAELGTFLAQAVETNDLQFMVETHSDYLVDRIVMAVRDGVLKASDVMLLFFERSGAEATVSPIHVNEAGQLTDAPPGYRRFFLAEEARFLSLDDSAGSQR